jgi:YD repeat-containing protein
MNRTLALAISTALIALFLPAPAGAQTITPGKGPGSTSSGDVPPGWSFTPGPRTSAAMPDVGGEGEGEGAGGSAGGGEGGGEESGGESGLGLATGEGTGVSEPGGSGFIDGGGTLGAELGLNVFLIEAEEGNTTNEGTESGGMSNEQVNLFDPTDPGDMEDFAELFGDVSYQVMDLYLPGRGLNFSWVRTYHSNLEVVGTLGAGWDHSYNVYVEQGVGGLTLYPGNGRADFFTLRANGNYTRNDYFIVGTFVADSGFSFTWPDGSTWNFRDFDGSAKEGKLETIVDRNGNTMTLAYDGTGRLTSITDTLARTTTLTYGTGALSDRILSVQAPTQTWSYGYYAQGDPDGPARDLETVTTPAVTGTPNFPSGKTTRYTYTKGNANARLNHNLLAVESPPGQTIVSHTYAATTDPADIDFDRVATATAHVDATTAHTTQFHYVDRSDPVNGAPRMMVIVNDGNGAVSEVTLNRFGHALVRKEYTGFADPALTTTELGNRPTGSLHTGAPTFYRTRTFYNRAGQPTRILHPEGNEQRFVYEIDKTTRPGRRRAGLLRERISDPGGIPSSPALITELFEYHATLPFVTKHTDEDGKVTDYTYDAFGNVLNAVTPVAGLEHDYTYNPFGQRLTHTWPDDGTGFRRRDDSTYWAAGVQRGYLRDFVRNAGAGQLQLAQRFHWNDRGRLVEWDDELNRTWTWTRNELDQIVKRQAPAIGGVRYEVDYYWDAQDDLYQVDVQSVDEDGAVEPNSHLTTAFIYDRQHRITDIAREIDVGVAALTGCEYDANDNRVLLKYDGAVQGSSPNQIVVFVYDARDLLFQVQRSQGPPDQATDQYDYDGNENLVALTTGLEAGGRATAYSYDGYDRLVSRVDPMLNELQLGYDGRSNLTGLTLLGERIDTNVPGAHDPLATTSFAYDDLGRRTKTIRHWFVLFPPHGTIGGGVSERTNTWSGIALDSTTDPDGHVTSYEYDSALRIEQITDPAGNVVDFTYDDAGNVTGRTETHASNLGPSTASSWTLNYDALNRVTRRDGPAGPPLRWRYDSRDNVRRSRDERLNDTHYEYDGLDRVISVSRDITDTGLGSGTLIGTQDTLFGYEYPFGIATLTDDDGYSTTYDYDDLGRLTGVAYDDPSSHTFFYDAHDDVVVSVDANGSMFTNTYDGLGRLQSQTIAPAGGAANDLTSRTFLYDGADRMVTALDDDSTVNWIYDSLSNVLKEELVPPTLGAPVTLNTIAAQDARGNTTTLVFPGGRNLTYEWDGHSRMTRVAEGGSTICTDDWAGPRQRLERRLYPSGAFSLFTYDSRLRPSQATTIYGGSTWVDRTSSWLSSGQLAGLDNDLVAGSDFAYASDSLGRLEQSDETDPNSTVTTITYALTDAGDRTAAGYSLSPGDAEVHQYTTTPSRLRTYDANGNLTLRDPIGPQPPGVFVYDALDRLVRFTSGGGVVTTYAYDALGRRVRTIRDATGAPQETLFAYLGERVVEQTDGAGATQATYVWQLGQEGAELDGGQTGEELTTLALQLGQEGAELDGGQTGEELTTPGGQVLNLQGGELGGVRATAALIEMRRAGTDTRLHYDSVGNLAAAVDAASGTLVEWYEYGDHGSPRIYDGANTPLTASAIGNPYVQQSRRYDPESRLLVLPGGQYEPAIARSVSRARLGYFGTADGNDRFTSPLVTGGSASLNNKYPEIGSSGQDGIQGACMPVRFTSRGNIGVMVDGPLHLAPPAAGFFPAHDGEHGFQGARSLKFIVGTGGGGQI